ncbi:hypothetical protein AYO22_04843 [Fonsecaea multimorphosa]|nr:hypothetical protein AYO22_04843 [Fonsecaea multimorphosa]
MSKYFVPGVAPLREAFQLASFIPNLKQPDQDGFPTPWHKVGDDYPALTERKDFRVQQQANLGKLLEESRDDAFKTNVTKLLSTSLGRSTSNTNWLGPCEVRKYTLISPKQVFKDLIKCDSVRDWMQDELEDGVQRVYFVVGYYTVLDAATLDGVHKSSSYGVESEVPVGDIASHGATLLIPGMLDLEVGGSVKHQATRTAAVASYLQGERVYAFCYRKVKFSIFKLKNRAASARLEQDNCWALTADNRGAQVKASKGVEVDLEDEEGEEDGPDTFDMVGDDE